MTSPGTVAKCLSEGWNTVSRERSLRVATLMGGGGLRSLGFPGEARIGNDAPTFDTAHLASLVFLLRDAIGDQATVCTGAGRAEWAGLWGFS